MRSQTKLTLLIVGCVAGVVMMLSGMSTLCTAGQAVVPVDEGVAGPLRTIGHWFLWAGYLLLILGGCLVAFLAAAAIRMVFGTVGDLAGGVSWLVNRVRDSWTPQPPVLETVVVTKDGKDITLGDMFGKANGQFKSLAGQLDSLRQALAEVNARTAHIEPPPPPPPPKSAAEIAAEQAAMIKHLQEQLVAMQKQAAAAKPVAVQPATVQPVAAPAQGAVQ